MSRERDRAAGLRPLRRGGTRAVVAFMAAGLAAVVLIGVLGYRIARDTAIRESIRDVRELAQVGARAVAPAITDAALHGDPAAVGALDEAVRGRVLSSRVVRVKIWMADGRISYSDDKRLVDHRYPLGDDELEALRSGKAQADLSDLTAPENRDERKYGKLLEVYFGTRTREGTPVLFEIYERFDAIAANGSRVLRAFAPALIGGVVALWLVQFPLALALSRRLRAGHRRERKLLTRAIESSEQERRRIAADLHDSVVQGLAGSSMSLNALAAQARRDERGDIAQQIERHADYLRQSVRELRTLVVSIAPPRLHEEGLAAALHDLASTLDARGITVALHVDDDVRPDEDSETLLFRGAQEAVRNVVSHSRAGRVEITVERDDGTARLRVVDDGVGFDTAAVADAPGRGHVGLRLLGELAEDAGGSLALTSTPGSGTTMTMEVPSQWR